MDEAVFGLSARGESRLTAQTKQELLRLLFADTRFDDLVRPLDVGLSFTTSSLAKGFAGTKKKIAYPLLE